MPEWRRRPGNGSHCALSVQQNTVHELWLHRGEQGHARGTEAWVPSVRSPPELKSRFKVLHYVEKPSTFVSDIINCGVYLFTADIFQHIGAVFQKSQQDMLL